MAKALDKKRVLVDYICKNNSDINIGLYGAAGAGKSSLINTTFSLLNSDDEYEEVVGTAPDELMGGHTFQREPVKLTEHITIVDNRGWHQWTNEDSLTELANQIDGRSRLTTFVEWNTEKETKVFLGERPVANKITCAVIVLKGTAGLDGLQGVEKLIDVCYKGTGRRPITIITHKDKVSDEEMADISNKLVGVLGITKSRIFFVENMTAETAELEPDTKLSLLKFLRFCITDGTQGKEYHRQKTEELEVEYKNKLKLVEEQTRERDKERDKEIKELQIETAVVEYCIVKTRQEGVEKETQHKIEMLEMEKTTKSKTDELWKSNYLMIQKEGIKARADAKAKEKYKGDNKSSK